MFYLMEGAFNNMITKLHTLLPKMQQQQPTPMHDEYFTKKFTKKFTKIELIIYQNF